MLDIDYKMYWYPWLLLIYWHLFISPLVDHDQRSSKVSLTHASHSRQIFDGEMAGVYTEIFQHISLLDKNLHPLCPNLAICPPLLLVANSYRNKSDQDQETKTWQHLQHIKWVILCPLHLKCWPFVDQQERKWCPISTDGDKHSGIAINSFSLRYGQTVRYSQTLPPS